MRPEKKRIAFIINDMRIGGAERVLSNLTTNLPVTWDIDIILSDASEIEYPYRGNIIDLGMKREKLPFALYYLLVLCKRIVLLRKLKRTRKYKACIGFADSANIANILSGNKYCKVISAVHSTLSEASRRKDYRYIVAPLVKMFYNKSDKIVAVSLGVKNDLVKNYGIQEEKITTIYNGCDFQAIEHKMSVPLSESEKKYFTDKNGIYIATMGRMDYPKAQWHLIRAFKRVIERNPEARLMILGAGELEAYLKALVNELNLTDSVCFMGFQKNPFQFLTHCQIFAFPSLYEGFPNALLEAMYCGLPVVATDFHTGAREVLAPELGQDGMLGKQVVYAQYGILTPVCDGKCYAAEDSLTQEEELLAKALNELLESPEKQRGYSSLGKKYVQQFSIDRMTEEWKSLIENEAEM